MNEMGVLSKEDLQLITDCARAAGYETQLYHVRDATALYVKRGDTFVYWNPLDASRTDFLDLMLRTNVKVEQFVMPGTTGCSDLLIRAYNPTRRGRCGMSQLVRQPQITPEQFCRTLVDAIAKHQRIVDRETLRLKRHEEHQRRMEEKHAA